MKLMWYLTFHLRDWCSASMVKALLCCRQCPKFTVAMCKQHKIYLNSVTIIYWQTCKSIRLLKKPNYWECVYTYLQYYINIFIYEKCAWFSWDRVINVDQHLHACLLLFTLVRQLGIESSNPRSSIHCIRSRSTFPGFLSQWVFSGFLYRAVYHCIVFFLG